MAVGHRGTGCSPRRCRCLLANLNDGQTGAGDGVAEFQASRGAVGVDHDAKPACRALWSEVGDEPFVHAGDVVGVVDEQGLGGFASAVQGDLDGLSAAEVVPPGAAGWLLVRIDTTPSIRW